MKKFITVKEVKAITPNMRYAQQIGGLDEDSLIKEFGAVEIRVDFKKEKTARGWSYHYQAEIYNNNIKGGFLVFSYKYSIDEAGLMVEDLNKTMQWAPAELLGA